MKLFYCVTVSWNGFKSAADVFFDSWKPFALQNRLLRRNVVSWVFWPQRFLVRLSIKFNLDSNAHQPSFFNISRISLHCSLNRYLAERHLLINLVIEFMIKLEHISDILIIVNMQVFNARAVWVLNDFAELPHAWILRKQLIPAGLSGEGFDWFGLISEWT